MFEDKTEVKIVRKLDETSFLGTFRENLINEFASNEAIFITYFRYAKRLLLGTLIGCWLEVVYSTVIINLRLCLHYVRQKSFPLCYFKVSSTHTNVVTAPKMAKNSLFTI